MRSVLFVLFLIISISACNVVLKRENDRIDTIILDMYVEEFYELCREGNFDTLIVFFNVGEKSIPLKDILSNSRLTFGPLKEYKMTKTYTERLTEEQNTHVELCAWLTVTYENKTTNEEMIFIIENGTVKLEAYHLNIP